MLDEIEPRQFDEFIAYREIEPDPDTRLREIVRRGFQLVLNAMGYDVDAEQLDQWYEEPSSDQEGVVSLMRLHYGPRGQ